MNLNLKEIALANKLFIFSLGICNSFVAFPFCIYRLICKQDSPIVFASVVSVFYSFFIPPKAYDLSRHLDAYRLFYESNVAPELNDKFINYLFNFCELFRLPDYFIPLISCFILFYVLSECYLKFSSNLSLSKRVLLFLVLYTVVPFLLFTGIRFSTGYSLFLYGLFINKNQSVKLLTFICAIFCHFAVSIAVFIYYLSVFVVKVERNKFGNIWILFAIIFLIVGLNINFFIDSFLAFFDSINTYLGSNVFNVKSYILESNALNSSEGLNINGIFVVFLKKAITSIILFSYIVFFNKDEDLITRIGLVFSLLSLLFINVTIFFDRFIPISFMIIIYAVFRRLSNNYDIKNYSSLFILFCLLCNNLFLRMLELKINFDYFYNSFFASKFFVSFIYRLWLL